MADYIERDMFLKIISHKPSSPTTEREDRLINGFISAVKNCPAAAVRPVVRGKWIEHYEPYSTGEEMIETQFGYECSICGRWEYEKEPFCNCGAMMEES